MRRDIGCGALQVLITMIKFAIIRVSVRWLTSEGEGIRDRGEMSRNIRHDDQLTPRTRTGQDGLGLGVWGAAMCSAYIHIHRLWEPVTNPKGRALPRGLTTADSNSSCEPLHSTGVLQHR